MGFLSGLFGVGSGKGGGGGKPDTPSGVSWGPDMPKEENQFNYPGTYREYFEHIFREDFPEYQVESDEIRKGRGVVYALARDGKAAVIIELMNESSEAQRMRRNCEKAGIPYLRFYYDHHGWWNTRSYVRERIRKAIDSAPDKFPF